MRKGRNLALVSKTVKTGTFWCQKVSFLYRKAFFVISIRLFATFSSVPDTRTGKGVIVSGFDRKVVNSLMIFMVLTENTENITFDTTFESCGLGVQGPHIGGTKLSRKRVNTGIWLWCQKWCFPVSKVV